MESILRTKLFIAQTSATLVTRPRLLDKLTAGLDKRLTLIAAPAGFGKTTVVANWLTTLTDVDVSWVSLDETDNTLRQFFVYVVAALQQNDSSVGTALLRQVESGGDLSGEQVMMQLINELSAEPQQRLLVLDDYHALHNARIHEAVTFLLAHMPPQLHLVLTTRTDPPLPLARLRARGQMTELRSADLTFTLPEATAFLNEQMQLDLSADDIALLETRTEGWIASLQLAALAMQATPQNRQTFLDNFAGSDRYIVDYLVSEVLAQQTETIRQFLQQTAILGRLCAPLCDALREATDSQVILSQLEENNLFLFPLDNQRQWYRYHHLFADLLHYRLHEQEEAQVAALHERASVWFEQQGLIEEAVGHAFSAENHTRVALLIEQHAHPLFSAGKFETIRQWMQRLPTTLITTRPASYLLQGLVLFRSGDFDGLSNHLSHPPDIALFTEEQRGEWLALQGYDAYICGAFATARQLAEEALTLIKAPALRMPTITLLGWCYDGLGDLDAAIATHQQTLRLAQIARSLTGTVANFGQLAILYARTGDWERVKQHSEQAIATAVAQQTPDIPLVGLAYIGIGRWHEQQGNNLAAIENLQKGIALCRQWGALHISAIHGYAALLAILRKQGMDADWLTVQQEAQQFANKPHLPIWASDMIDAAPQETGLVEALTPREQEVLQLMSAGLSAPQIAEQMVVGVSTVRTHIKRIYAKLAVHSRHEALQKSRELNLT